jgi:hypothetical protein
LPTPNLTPLGDVTINNPVITIGVVSVAPTTNTYCYSCQANPTGTGRNVVIRNQHLIKLFPNPTETGKTNLSIEAHYSDQAVISIVDLFGNIYYRSDRKEIIKGNNLFPLTIPFQLRSYGTYFIHVRFKNYDTSIQIFTKNQ